MTPAARLQAAIEILDDVIEAARTGGAAADTLIARYFRTRRYAGSKDRRAVREHVYAAVRRTAVAPANGRSAILGLAADEPDLLALFDGAQFGPAPVGKEETAAARMDIPDWLAGRFAADIADSDIASLRGRAPLDIRVNLSRISRKAALAELGAEAEPGELSPSAIRLPMGFRVEDHGLWQSGLIEIQDEGSQIVADVCDAKAGATIVDLCAGAGGKTLALIDAVGGNARIIACDTDRRRLSRFAPRAARAGTATAETRLLDPGREGEALADLADKSDLVLVDAPCSGTGTWRRNPEAAWRLTPKRVDEYRKLQARLLALGADLLAPGGFLVYAVCSLLGGEGEEQISAFLATRSDFRKVAPANPIGMPACDGFMLTPARHGTDGFFFARLQRTC